MSVPQELARTVRARANGRCQYCQMHESLQGATFHIEHIIPKSKGGLSNLENLTLVCPGCNLRKSDRIAGIDPATGNQSPIFRPMTQHWSEHFRFNGYLIEGLTVTGRTTVAALDLNHQRRRRIRMIEEMFGLYPLVH